MSEMPRIPFHAKNVRHGARSRNLAAPSRSMHDRFLALVRNPGACMALVACSLVAVFLCQLNLGYVDPAGAVEAYGTESRVLKLAWVFSHSVGLAFPEDLALVVVVFALFGMFWSLESRKKRSVTSGILAFFFSCCMVAGGVFSGSETGFDAYELAKMLLSAVGYFAMLYAGLALVQWFLDEKVASADATRAGRVVAFVFERHAFLAPLAIIAVAWLPYLILCYPGTTDPFDVLDQLEQYHGIYSRTAAWVDFDQDSWLYVSNNNPFFSTVVTNSFIDFGSFIGSQNIGMFLLVLLQSALLASGFAMTVKLQKMMRSPYVLRFVSIATFAFAPLFPCYAICITKDTLFTGLVLWFILLLVLAIWDKSLFMRHKGLFVAFFLVTLFMALIRNNGVYMLFLTIPFIFLVRGKQSKIIGGLACCVIVVYMAYGNVVLPALGVEGGSVKEMLSAPFQQTARYVSTYPEEVTEEERSAIEGVLEYESLFSYDPGLSDGVKDTYDKDATSEELSRYFSAWLSMGLKHPLTYVEATVANCYSYFYPQTTAGWVWTQLNRYGANDSLDLTPDYNESGFYMEQNPAWEPYRSALTQWYTTVNNSVFAYVTNMGLCAWVILAFAAFFVRKRAWGGVAPLMPIVVLLLVCVLSPQNGNIRYALPMIAATMTLVTYGVGMFVARRADKMLQDTQRIEH